MKQFTIAVMLLSASSLASAQSVGYVAINGVRYPKCEQTLASGDAARHSMLDGLRDDIENIEVVKGTAAVRLYGPDAEQGAILVTLKKGVAVPSTICNAWNTAGIASPDPVMRYLYPPELVLAHQEAIGLTTVQRDMIQLAGKTAEIQVAHAQAALATESEKLAKLLAVPGINEAGALEEIDRVLATEREVKRAQLALLVRVKNQLTAAQQEKLDKLK